MLQSTVNTLSELFCNNVRDIIISYTCVPLVSALDIAKLSCDTNLNKFSFKRLTNTAIYIKWAYEHKENKKFINVDTIKDSNYYDCLLFDDISVFFFDNFFIYKSPHTTNTVFVVCENKLEFENRENTVTVNEQKIVKNELIEKKNHIERCLLNENRFVSILLDNKHVKQLFVKNYWIFI